MDLSSAFRSDSASAGSYVVGGAKLPLVHLPPPLLTTRVTMGAGRHPLVFRQPHGICHLLYPWYHLVALQASVTFCWTGSIIPDILVEIARSYLHPPPPLAPRGHVNPPMTPTAILSHPTSYNQPDPSSMFLFGPWYQLKNMFKVRRSPALYYPSSSSSSSSSPIEPFNRSARCGAVNAHCRNMRHAIFHHHDTRRRLRVEEHHPLPHLCPVPIPRLRLVLPLLHSVRSVRRPRSASIPYPVCSSGPSVVAI